MIVVSGRWSFWCIYLILLTDSYLTQMISGKSFFFITNLFSAVRLFTTGSYCFLCFFLCRLFEIFVSLGTINTLMMVLFGSSLGMSRPRCRLIILVIMISTMVRFSCFLVVGTTAKVYCGDVFSYRVDTGDLLGMFGLIMSPAEDRFSFIS